MLTNPKSNIPISSIFPCPVLPFYLFPSFTSTIHCGANPENLKENLELIQLLIQHFC